jgi:hypothetical protein
MADLLFLSIPLAGASWRPANYEAYFVFYYSNMRAIDSTKFMHG